jgi:hypothetical protein
LGKTVKLVNTDDDAMEAVADFLRSVGYDTHFNPRIPQPVVAESLVLPSLLATFEGCVDADEFDNMRP